MGIYYIAPLLGPVIFTLCSLKVFNYLIYLAIGCWVHLWRCIDVGVQLARYLLVPFYCFWPESSLFRLLLPRHIQARAKPYLSKRD